MAAVSVEIKVFLHVEHITGNVGRGHDMTPAVLVVMCRGASLIKTRPPPSDPFRTLGIGLR